MPQFSIVMPTRNRAHLLRLSLQSALTQDFDNYEVLVSDNYSTDDTPKVVAAAACSRLRYVKTPQRMSMPDHWQWALAHARGEYLMYLCDDDALSPEALTRVSRQVGKAASQVIVIGHGCYWYPSWPEEAMRNVFHGGPYSGNCLDYDSRQTLGDLFARTYHWRTPRMNNSFCHRAAIANVGERAGSFFLAPAPDYTACAMLLATVSKYMYLDEPLLVFGVCEDSIGTAAFCRGRADVEFLAEFREPVCRLSPIASTCVTNSIVESLLRARAAMPERFAGLDINPAEFYLRCSRDLKQLRHNGVDVSGELKELRSFRRKQGAKAQILLLQALIRDMISRSPLGPAALALKRALGTRDRGRTTGNGQRIRLDGRQEGFSNILECAQHLPEIRRRLCRPC